MLSFGPLPPGSVHLCIDVQRVFAERTPWHTPWMSRVLPVVCRIAEARPTDSVFTRFMPPLSGEQASGSWRRYYERWRDLTLERAGPSMFELVPELARLVPPATVFDKRFYSPWHEPSFDAAIAQRAPGALVMTGAETDICVLAAVMGAVDRGYRVVLATDALCSSSDRTHDALLTLYHQRFAEQIETADSEEILQAWRD
jgi:nicotinamidase-related amidase